MDDDYVGETQADENYRILRIGIDAMRDEAEVPDSGDEQDSGTAAGSKRTRKEALEKEQGEVLRTRAGIILPAKNGFDFVEKPRSRIAASQVKSHGSKDSGMDRLRKAMLKMGKKGKSAAGNNKMQIVKNDIC